MTSPFEIRKLKEDSFYYDADGWDDDKYVTLSITKPGAYLVTAIQNRIESLRNQRYNYSLFGGLSAPAKKTWKKPQTSKESQKLSSSPNEVSKHKATKTKPIRKTGPKKDKKQGMSTPADRKPSTVRSIAATTERAPAFAVGGETGKFLEYVEKKPKESVVATLDGPHGSGKTTTLFRFLNDFAMAGNSCLFASLEEHPESNLITDKKNKLLNPKAQELIDTADHFGSYQEFVDTVDYYDCIFLDSWQKLVRMVGNIRLDEDIRKRFDGKVFVIIFQRTTTGKTKGGADILYDGDIIIRLTKEAKFADNYAYFDKNRYAKGPKEAIRWNVQGGYVYDAETGEKAPVQAPEKTPDILSIEAVAIDG